MRNTYGDMLLDLPKRHADEEKWNYLLFLFLFSIEICWQCICRSYWCIPWLGMVSALWLERDDQLEPLLGSGQPFQLGRVLGCALAPEYQNVNFSVKFVQVSSRFISSMTHPHGNGHGFDNWIWSRYWHFVGNRNFLLNRIWLRYIDL